MMQFDPNLPYSLPELPPTQDVLTQPVLLALVDAAAALAELRGSTSELHNPYALISPPALLKEALTSNAIENIHTTVESVMQDALNVEEARSTANKEVLKYREALLHGFRSNLPISTRVVAKVHETILPSNQGKFRKLPNGIKNFATGEMLYTPPRASDVNRLMGNLENFLHQGSELHPIIKAIMAHYQFEAIHPFSDGNGRTGRIIFVLYLCEQGLIKWPVLFLSGYLLARRDEYYERLLAVTRDEDWKGFLLFMLKAVAEQAKRTTELSKRALTFSRQLEADVKKLPGHVQAHDLVEELFWFPYVTASLLARRLHIHFTTASRYLDVLKKAGILIDAGKEGRYHIYVCPSVLKLYQ